MDNNQGKPNMPKKPKRPNMMWLYFSLIMLLIGLFMLEGTSDPGQTSSLPFFSESAAAKKDLSYTDLQAYMEKDAAERSFDELRLGVISGRIPQALQIVVGHIYQ